MQLLIIEDELLGMETLTQFLREIDPSIQVTGHTDSISASVNWLQQHPAPDLILMDIELSDGQSFEIFNQVDIKSPVIFTTSYDEYALKAFKVNSIDYLLKPIKKEELKKALEKFRDLKKNFTAGSLPVTIETLIQDLAKQQAKTYRNRFLVKQGQRLISFETSDIAYFYADNRICFLVTWDKQKYIVDYSMEQLEGMLDPQIFFRANRAFIVQAKAVAQIHNFFSGKLKLLLTPSFENEDVIVSREKAAAFKDWMGK